MFRSALAAAQVRIVALEEELAKMRAARAGDTASRIAELEAELDRLRATLSAKRVERRWPWIPIVTVVAVVVGMLKLGCVELVSPDAGEQVYRGFCFLGFGRDCYFKAVLAHRRDDLAAAERGYREACDDGYLPGCVNLGSMLDRDPVESENLARRACDGGEMLGCSNLAIKLQTRGDLPESENLSRRACDGGSDLGCVALARTLLLSKRSKEALEAATRAIRRNATLASAHRELGHALLLQDDRDGAVAAYRQAVQLSHSAKLSGESERRREPMGTTIRRELAELRPWYPELAANFDAALARSGEWDAPR